MRIKLSHIKTVNRQGTSRIPAAHMLISYYQKKNGQSLSQKVGNINILSNRSSKKLTKMRMIYNKLQNQGTPKVVFKKH